MQNKDLTVVVINDFDYIQGGATKVALDTAQLLYESGVNVIYFSSTHKDNNYKFKQVCVNQKECLHDGIKGAFRGLYNFKAAKELKKLLNTLDKDKTIIHIHGWTKSLSSSIFRTIGKLDFKVVLTIHDYFTACPNGGFFNYKQCEICRKKAMSFDCIKTNCDSRNYAFKIYRVVRQFIQNKNIKKCKQLSLINISDFSLDKLKKYIPKNINVTKIYNPISIEKDKRCEVENNDYYIYVGRVSKEKGTDIFCEAMKELDLKAYVVGDGALLPELKEKYKDTKIEFTGWQDSKKVKEYMYKSKCLIFPSRCYEGAPLTILEAHALGIPCIVVNQCAGVDFINDNNGFIYNSNDIHNLLKIIKDYDKENIKLLSEKTYNNYWNNPLDKEKYIKNIFEYYLNIIKGE